MVAKSKFGLVLLFFAIMAVASYASVGQTRSGFFTKQDPLQRRALTEELLEQNRNKTILQEKLLSSYKKFVPPAGGADCEIQLALYSIVEVSTALQTLKMQGWWRHYWNDERLSWDADLWGVDAIVYDIAEIWVPDDIVYELIEEENLGNVALTVYPSGSVFYSAPRVTTVGCKMTLSKYPYDIQTCQFTVGSMSFDGSLVDVIPRTVGSPPDYFEEAAVYQDKTGIDLTQYRHNKEFSLTKVRIVSQNFYYNCCPEPYPVIVYEITIQRQTLTFLSGILVPIIAVTFVGFSVLLMPAPLSGARPSISISVMFTTTAIYLVASRKLPEVGEYTMIGRLYMASLAASLCMTFVSILSSAINLVVSEQNNNRADLLAVFRHYDSDRSGALNFEEADRALSALGLTERERDYILAKHDLHESEDIGIDEWLRLGEISRSLRPTTQYSVAISALVSYVVGPTQYSNAVHPAPSEGSSEDAEALKLKNQSPEDAAEAGQAALGGDDEVRPMPVLAQRGSMNRMASLRSMGGKSFRMGAKRGDLGVEVVAEWLVELGVDDKVLQRFEEEAVDVLALAHLPLDKLEGLGVTKIGNQARLIGLAKDKLDGRKRTDAACLCGQPHAIGFRGDPTAGLGGGGSGGSMALACRSRRRYVQQKSRQRAQRLQQPKGMTSPSSAACRARRRSWGRRCTR